MELKRILKAISIIRPSQIRIRRGNCPLHGPSIFLRLNDSMLGVRCAYCGAAPIATSIAAVLQELIPDFRNKEHYELSSRGPFFEFLEQNVEKLTYTEYFDDIEPGKYKKDVQCQDVQKLTFEDSVFDVVTSTEVFEHVPDDIAGFGEIYRVLRNGGYFIFTVPLSDSEDTVTRAVIEDGRIKYLLSPEYHDDSIRGERRVLVFRDYGRDIVHRLKRAGFRGVRIVEVPDFGSFGYYRGVMVARK